jgi:hypothetical protein
MKIKGLSLIFFISLMLSCEDSRIERSTKFITLDPINQTTVQRFTLDKGVFFDPGNFNHEEIYFIPISYYAPVIDNSQVSLRVLVPLFYHPGFGMSQATTINITSCDSLEMDGEYLKLYSQSSSEVTSLPNQPGTGLNYFTDQTTVMIMYEDSTMNIIPNFLYQTEWLNVPEKNIIGFYFLVTPYVVN